MAFHFHSTGRYARLAKDGRRILCDTPDCGEELALLGDDGREVTVEPGWQYDEASDLWHLSNHARKRWRRGQPPQNRRGLLRPQGKDGRSSANTDRARAGEIVPGKWIHPREPVTLPTQVRCPGCQFVQILDDDHLGLA